MKTGRFPFSRMTAKTLVTVETSRDMRDICGTSRDVSRPFMGLGAGHRGTCPFRDVPHVPSPDGGLLALVTVPLKKTLLRHLHQTEGPGFAPFGPKIPIESVGGYGKAGNSDDTGRNQRAERVFCPAECSNTYQYRWKDYANDKISASSPLHLTLKVDKNRPSTSKRLVAFIFKSNVRWHFSWQHGIHLLCLKCSAWGPSAQCRSRGTRSPGLCPATRKIEILKFGFPLVIRFPHCRRT